MGKEKDKPQLTAKKTNTPKKIYNPIKIKFGKKSPKKTNEKKPSKNVKKCEKKSTTKERKKTNNNINLNVKATKRARSPSASKCDNNEVKKFKITPQGLPNIDNNFIKKPVPEIKGSKKRPTNNTTGSAIQPKVPKYAGKVNQDSLVKKSQLAKQPKQVNKNLKKNATKHSADSSSPSTVSKGCRKRNISGEIVNGKPEKFKTKSAKANEEIFQELEEKCITTGDLFEKEEEAINCFLPSSPNGFYSSQNSLGSIQTKTADTGSNSLLIASDEEAINPDADIIEDEKKNISSDEEINCLNQLCFLADDSESSDSISLKEPDAEDIVPDDDDIDLEDNNVKNLESSLVAERNVASTSYQNDVDEIDVEDNNVKNLESSLVAERKVASTSYQNDDDDIDLEDNNIKNLESSLVAERKVASTSYQNDVDEIDLEDNNVKNLESSLVAERKVASTSYQNDVDDLDLEDNNVKNLELSLVAETKVASTSYQNDDADINLEASNVENLESHTIAGHASPRPQNDNIIEDIEDFLAEKNYAERLGTTTLSQDTKVTSKKYDGSYYTYKGFTTNVSEEDSDYTLEDFAKRITEKNLEYSSQQSSIYGDNFYLPFSSRLSSSSSENKIGLHDLKPKTIQKCNLKIQEEPCFLSAREEIETHADSTRPTLNEMEKLKSELLSLSEKSSIELVGCQPGLCLSDLCNQSPLEGNINPLPLMFVVHNFIEINPQPASSLSIMDMLTDEFIFFQNGTDSLTKGCYIKLEKLPDNKLKTKENKTNEKNPVVVLLKLEDMGINGEKDENKLVDYPGTPNEKYLHVKNRVLSTSEETLKIKNKTYEGQQKRSKSVPHLKNKVVDEQITPRIVPSNNVNLFPNVVENNKFAKVKLKSNTNFQTNYTGVSTCGEKKNYLGCHSKESESSPLYKNRVFGEKTPLKISSNYVNWSPDMVEDFKSIKYKINSNTDLQIKNTTGFVGKEVKEKMFECQQKQTKGALLIENGVSTGTNTLSPTNIISDLSEMSLYNETSLVSTCENTVKITNKPKLSKSTILNKRRKLSESAVNRNSTSFLTVEKTLHSNQSPGINKVISCGDTNSIKRRKPENILIRKKISKTVVDKKDLPVHLNAKGFFQSSQSPAINKVISCGDTNSIKRGKPENILIRKEISKPVVDKKNLPVQQNTKFCFKVPTKKDLPAHLNTEGFFQVPKTIIAPSNETFSTKNNCDDDNTSFISLYIDENFKNDIERDVEQSVIDEPVNRYNRLTTTIPEKKVYVQAAAGGSGSTPNSQVDHERMKDTLPSTPMVDDGQFKYSTHE